MKLDNVGEVIANREFTFIRNGQEPVQVELLMGRPEKFPDHTDYYCPYQIKGLRQENAVAIGGVDAFQAMQLALNTIGVELEVRAKESGGELCWGAGGNGYLGFPDPPTKK